eukprot:m.684040 g.684040  ORF g.684040 m.684040 type:complete len:586 (+) comp22832_c0_seq15:218-1975(+)
MNIQQRIAHVLITICGVDVIAHGRSQLIPDSLLGLTEVAWHSEKTGIYLGSPSVVRMPNGNILTSADRFGPGNHLSNCSVYVSKDNGSTWSFSTWAISQYFSNLFTLPHDAPNSVYLLGTDSGGKAQIKIALSRDGGATFAPEDASILFSLNETTDPTHHGFATGPTPALVASDGRLYRAYERCHVPFSWGKGFEAVVVAGPSDPQNVLDARQWTLSASLPFNLSWLPEDWITKCDNPGYLEGNVVEAPDGTLYDILRFNSEPNVLGNWAIALKINIVNSNTTVTTSTSDRAPAMHLTFHKLVPFPGGHTKFVIRRDAHSGLYFSLVNPNNNIEYTDQRNILSLSMAKHPSGDVGGNWTVIYTLLMDDTGFSADDSVRYTGFHYVDWQFDNPDASGVHQDIIYAIRTAYRGAESYHNSNRLTFKRLSNFRQLLVDENDTAAVHVTGSNFQISPFCTGSGCLAFTNRDYVWTDIGGYLGVQASEGRWSFTRIAGQGTGEPANNASISVAVQSAGSVYVINDGIEADWLIDNNFSLLPLMQACYRDTKHSCLSVFRKEAKVGDTFTLPQKKGGFAGTMALVPRAKLT